jgi:hypothetical protein
MREEVAASARGRRYFMEAMYNDGRTSLGFKGENSVSQTAFNGRVADGPITASEVLDANGLPSIPLKPSFDPEEFARFGRQIIRGLDADAVASGFQFQKVYATRFHLEAIDDVLGRDLSPEDRSRVRDATFYIDAFKWGRVRDGFYQDPQASFVHAMTGTVPDSNDPRWNTTVDAPSGMRMTARNAGERALQIFRDMYADRDLNPLDLPAGTALSRQNARDLSNAWVRANFELAQQALEYGNRDLALTYFAYALHTVQDSTSPMHHNFEPWGIPGARGEWEHGTNEYYNPGPGSNMYRAT